MSFYDAIRVGASGAADFEIERSLRFNRPDSTYLTKSLGSTSNRRTFTYSFWVKRTVQNSEQCLIYNGHPSSTPYGEIRFEYQGSNIHELNWYSYDGSHQFQLRTNRVFRDPSAWYHIVLALDTTQATQSNRAKIYVNGIQETSFKTETYPSQNTDTGYNVSGNTHSIGGFRNTSNSFDGYVAEFNFIDGQQLTPSSFAETNSDTGQWVPIDTSGLTFGTNGFRLKFADNSGTTATTLGKDSSGNGNNFTPNNFSVSAGAGNDSLEDTPTNNFCTLNPLDKMGTVTVTEGNLKVVINGDNASLITGSFGVSSGKWYYEAVADTAGAGFVGWIRKDVSSYTSYPYQQGGSLIYFSQNGARYKDGDGGASYGAAYGNGDIIGCAINLDDNEVTWYKNNTSQGTLSIEAGTYNPNTTTGGSSATFTFNFGQRAFSYTPPTGFNALNSANLSDPTILLPNKHFNTLIWDGNSTQDRDISGLNFQPDWVWIKSRNGGTYGGGLYYHHVVWDSLRGVGSNTIGAASRKELTVNEVYVEGRGANYSDYYGHVSAFNSDGFELDHVTGEPPLYVNRNTNTYVGWSWNAGETDGATYTVKVVSDSGNKYRFNDFGTSAVTLDLAEGGTYTFDGSDSSMSSHPFVIGTAANGSEYSTGVTYQLDGASVTYSQYTSGYSSATTRKLIITVPASAPQLYYWCSVHSGMGGAINTNTTLGSSNFDGTGQAIVKANTTAGFSIVLYTGNASGSSSSAVFQTIGHGLGVTPQLIIIKSRSWSNSSAHWATYHHQLTDANTDYLKLDTNDARTQTDVNYMGSTLPTSSVFSLGFNYTTNKASETYVAYCFSEVAGYSKFGSYTGNGVADGTFVFTGFRPAWVMTKRSSAARNWIIYDNKRGPFNEVDNFLEADTPNAEDPKDMIDFTANGFKLRDSDTDVNSSGDTYIYIAFAESPFKNSRAR